MAMATNRPASSATAMYMGAVGAGRRRGGRGLVDDVDRLDVHDLLRHLRHVGLAISLAIAAEVSGSLPVTESVMTREVVSLVTLVE